MGDRCYMQVTCRARDKKHFIDLGFSETGEAKGPGDEPWVLLEDEQANYAHSGAIGDIAKKGVPFHGFHEAGCDYGACSFACDGKEYAEVEVNFVNLPVVGVRNGVPVAEELESVRKYESIKAGLGFEDADDGDDSNDDDDVGDDDNPSSLEDDEEQQRRDEKNGLYGGRDDIAN